MPREVSRDLQQNKDRKLQKMREKQKEKRRKRKIKIRARKLKQMNCLHSEFVLSQPSKYGDLVAVIQNLGKFAVVE